MHDQIELDRPLDRAVNAIEYVIRHRGAQHLRPAACRLSLPERESMDVAFIFTIFFIALAYVVVSLACSTSSKAFQCLRTDKIKKNQ